MSQREILVTKINQAKEELKTAGAIHSRDLRKHIRRMETQIRRYDRYQSMAKGA